MGRRKHRPGVHTTDWAPLRLELWHRAGGRCEACLAPLPNTDVAVHHRKLRSQGGTDDPTNLLLLHGDCHRMVHAHPQASVEHGYIVPSWAEPATTPVQPSAPWLPR